MTNLPPLPPTSTYQRFDGGNTVQACFVDQVLEYGQACFEEGRNSNPTPYGWLIACDEEMIVAHLGVANLSDSIESATAKLKSLIDWHVAVATDPAVSSEMHEYGALCRKQALEEAVKACEAIESEHLDTYKHNPGPNAYDPHYQGLSMGAGECAEKIRELLK